MTNDTISRRSTLKAAVALGLAAKTTSGTAAAAANAEDSQPPATAKQDWSNPDLIKHIRAAQPLINVERAYAIMDKYGLDGLVASSSENIYYLSSHHGIMQWMGRTFSTFAFFPRREDGEAALVVPSSMLYHLDYRPTWVPSIKVYTAPQRNESGDVVVNDNGDPLAVTNPRFWPVRNQANYKHGDLVQLALFSEFSGKTSADALHGLKEAIAAGAGAKARIGFDDPRAGRWLNDIGLADLQTVDADNIFKEIRMVKTEAEIALLREAAQRNEAALDYAIEQIEPGVPLLDIELAHARKWGELDGHAVWLIANVDGLNSGRAQPGDFMKIDSVGVYKGYHGDIGRTVSLGEPTDELARRIEANTKVARQVYGAIEPGMPFTKASELFSTLMKDEGFDFALASTHCVGLVHTDQPSPLGVGDPEGMPTYAELKFEPGTVFTLDMPHNEMGWGTSHVEDMIAIREKGYEALSSMDTSLRVRPA